MRLVLTILCSLTSLFIFGQKMTQYNQFVLDEYMINPAAAGIDAVTDINLTGRSQWAGIKNHPETYSASITGRIFKSTFDIKKRKIKRKASGRVGVGAGVINDRNGAVYRTSFRATYAYHIKVRMLGYSRKQLSFGLTAMATQIRIDPEKAWLKEPGDPLESKLYKSSFIPDFSFGAAISDRRSRIGFSVNQILQLRSFLNGISYENDSMNYFRQYNLHGIYKIFIDDQWEVEPSTVIILDNSLKYVWDVTTRVFYDRDYWFGLSYRTSRDLMVHLGLKAGKFHVGYIFNYNFTDIGRSTYGSHELMVKIRLSDNYRRYRWFEWY